MNFKNLHRWDIPPREAVQVQKELCKSFAEKSLRVKDLEYVAGVDVSVKNDMSQAAIVVLSFPDLEVVETVKSKMPVVFPYVPGLLSFREGPVILECVKKLKTAPSVFVFDGQGIAHPRFMGIACHMGIILDRPSIGSAKSHLFGSFEPPGSKKGDHSLMRDADNRPIGAVLTTRNNTRPVFVSPGQLMDIPSAIKIILACSPKYKLPEPIRAAHSAAHL